jgi:hypothetical protein
MAFLPWRREAADRRPVDDLDREVNQLHPLFARPLPPCYNAKTLMTVGPEGQVFPSQARLYWLVASVAAALSCGGGETLDVPTTGTLEITTSTTGVETDADGYAVQVDAQAVEPIGATGSLRKTDIAPGDHTIQLAGIAANCSVVGVNPRTVTVRAGEPTPVPFHIACNATTGSLRIAAATSGLSPDPDGYTITLDGNARSALGVTAEVTLESIPPGSHAVGLSGVADNCEVQGDNPRNVAVAAGSTGALAFTVQCAEPPAITGILRITTSTSGADQDQDGYTVAVDGGTDQPIGVAATMTLANLEAGAHTVQLSGVTANCTLAGANPRSVTVPSGSEASVAFNVTCVVRPPNLGALQVKTVTTGAGSDPDGYVVSVDGRPGEPIGANATLAIADLTPGVHTAGLSGISDNCQVAGANPLSATVTVGVASLVSFSIECREAPPATGTLTVITTTTGSDPDPDGYGLAIDGGPDQSIPVNATTSVANLPAGAHTVGLSGVAGNCTLEGDNPRTIEIPAGGNAELSFAVSCVAGPGNLTITTISTGSSIDPDGYAVSVDGGAAQPIAVSGSLTVPGLAAGAHTVTLSGLASNCGVTGGENPRSVTIAGAEATTEFVVSCTSTTGSLTVTISGLPTGTAAAVTVTGPNGYSQAVTATSTLTDLTPGPYVLTSGPVTVNGTSYIASPDLQNIEIAANVTAAVAISYGPSAGASLNLRIDGLYLTQGTQTYPNAVPLVAGRDGFLRVFVVANEDNTARPNVRVRFYRRGSLIRTAILSPSIASTPTAVQEDQLELSWNIPVPGPSIEGGLSILADVDPDNEISESDETDNTFPLGGTPQALDVRTVPAFAIRFIPVRQRANGRQGNVSEASKEQFLELTRRIYPLSQITADVHAVYTTTTEAALSADFETWNTVLSEIYALRIIERGSPHYYGVVNPGPNPSWAGIGYLGIPAALGYDNAADRSRVAAHELGHNWNRNHAPCGNPGGPDLSFPYSGGLIGVFGFDLVQRLLRPPYYTDIMGYCRDPWVSDYTYQGVLAYRAANPVVASAVRADQPCLLLWGRIVNGQPVLEPAFQVVTRPHLPSRPGPYRIEGRTSAGVTLFSLSFEAAEVADDPNGSRHFAFAVPVDEAGAAQLESIRFTGPGAPALLRTRPAPLLRLGPAQDSVRARRTAEGVSLMWNSTVHPMLMARDPETGEVLSLARGGEVEVRTGKTELDVTVSDQVQSRRVRVLVGP